ncbi:MAG: stage II sporulation protein P [Eubacteriales bacterium]
MEEEQKLPETNVLLEEAPVPSLPAEAGEAEETMLLQPETEAIEEAIESEPAEEEVCPPHAGKGRGRRVLHMLLRRVLPAACLITAVAVYAALAVLSLMETDITVTRLLRTMLGEFTGGAENVRFTETALPEEILSPKRPASDRSGEAEPSAPENSGESEEAVSDPSGMEAPAESSFYRLDMSSQAERALGLINETPYEVDLNALAEAPRVIPLYRELAETYGDDEPVVLLLHTHATEAYADCAADGFRSRDNSKNVTAVGEIVAKELQKNGIGVLHCTELFDDPDFNMAYYNAALAIRRYLADYPSLSYIIDIHRDSILSGERYVRPVTEEGGETAAQIMFVIGTDYGGSGHTGWRDNLALAARLQVGLQDEHPSLMRDINLRSASFNEQYTSGSLLVEIGSCASTMEEVQRAAQWFAAQLAEEILG